MIDPGLVNDGKPFQGFDVSMVSFCRYRERCHSEVRTKLYELGFTTPEVERQLANLIEAGLLNEELYARAYARGKFRMLQWGKEKIKQQLKLRKISDYCIRKAMQEIDEGEYENTLSKLALRKWKESKGDKSLASRKSKLYRFLIQKGYERKLAMGAINNCVKPT